MGWFMSGSKQKTIIQEIPEIIIKERLKKIIISGKSRMPDPAKFYEEFKNKLENCFSEFGNTLFIEFRLDYINSGSSKWIYHVLTNMQSLSRRGVMEITWYYEEDDEVMEEAGEILQSVLQIPFHLKEI